MTSVLYKNIGLRDELVPSGVSNSERLEIADSVSNAYETLWTQHENGTLSYLHLGRQQTEHISDWAKSIPDSIDTILLIGIGGSSLGPRAISESWSGGTRRLLVSENVDPVSFEALWSTVIPAQTMVLVITKSGSTVETMAKFSIAWQRFGDAGLDQRQHFVAITDPERGPLRQMVSELEIPSFAIPPEVGGRFSVLTAVGLVPLAAIGYPIDELLAGAEATTQHFRDNGDVLNTIAADHFLLWKKGFETTVVMPYLDALVGFSEWFCQLWGESLGKKTRSARRVGLTPVRALGAVDQHSQVQLYVEGPLDKHVVFFTAEESLEVRVPESGLPEALAHLHGATLGQMLDAEQRGTAAALAVAGCPTSHWKIDSVSPENIGALMMSSMIVTSLVGTLMDVNPYDQPGVELGKRVAHGLLGREENRADAALAPAPSSGEDLKIR